MSKRFSGVLVAALALACVVGTSSKADAAFIAAICDDLTCSGGNDFLVTDNSAADTIGANGAINFSTSAFGYALVVNTSQSKPIIGSATLPQLDVTFTATGTGTVFLYAGDTDFLGAHSFNLSLGGTNSGGSGTVTGRAWGGSTNNRADLLAAARDDRAAVWPRVLDVGVWLVCPDGEPVLARHRRRDHPSDGGDDHRRPQPVGSRAGVDDAVRPRPARHGFLPPPSSGDQVSSPTSLFVGALARCQGPFFVSAMRPTRISRTAVAPGT